MLRANSVQRLLCLATLVLLGLMMTAVFAIQSSLNVTSRRAPRDFQRLVKRTPQGPPTLSLPGPPVQSPPESPSSPTGPPSLPIPSMSIPSLPSIALPTISLPSIALPSIALPSFSLPPPQSILPSISPPALPPLFNATAQNDNTNVGTIVGGAVGGVLGLGVILALLLLWWYLKGRDGRKDKLQSGLSSRGDLSETDVFTPYHMNNPVEVPTDTEKTAVATPYETSTSFDAVPQAQPQFYNHGDPYGLTASRISASTAQAEAYRDKYGQPRYMGGAEAY